MVPLHRHQIAWLNEAGWRRLQTLDRDATARDCLACWATMRLPLVVTQQAGNVRDDSIALGLPAPGRWGRQRLALSVPRSDVLYFDEFPFADRVSCLLSPAARPAWRRLCIDLQDASVNARVYGSYGWQLLSGFDHVRAGSDIDLWVSVSNPAQADVVAAHLQRASGDLPRVDGELMFRDGAAVAWREWLAWRAGRVKSLLVKTLAGSALVHVRCGQGAAVIAEAA
jgi:phosphoribosyl-dephospho-CoA transferase